MDVSLFHNLNQKRSTRLGLQAVASNRACVYLDSMETLSNVQSVSGLVCDRRSRPVPVLEAAIAVVSLGRGPLSSVFLSRAEATRPDPVSSTSHPKREIVLRKQPPGHILPSAHRVLREATIMRALQGYLSPVLEYSRLVHLLSIIGAPFFLMQFVEGIVFPDYTFSDLSPKQRLQIFRGMSSTLAAIHAVPHVQAGLSCAHFDRLL